MTRRELVAARAATGYIAGFAASVQPVMAQTAIVTSAAGMDAGMVQVATPSGPIPAYRAVKSGTGKRPLILVVQEIFGVHEHIKDVCRRLAALGYLRRCARALRPARRCHQAAESTEMIGRSWPRCPTRR